MFSFKCPCRYQFWFSVMGMIGIAFSSSGSEFELKGRITQTITDPNVSAIQTTDEFTIFVRGCGWLIQTIDESGRLREVGSTNGSEVYESDGNRDFISGTGIPVELLDK